MTPTTWRHSKPQRGRPAHALPRTYYECPEHGRLTPTEVDAALLCCGCGQPAVLRVKYPTPPPRPRRVGRWDVLARVGPGRR